MCFIGCLQTNHIHMTNSFYYFFSAAAQVLAAILALFGVFVIFKIQSLTSELLEEGRKLEHIVTSKISLFNEKGVSLILKLLPKQ